MIIAVLSLDGAGLSCFIWSQARATILILDVLPSEETEQGRNTMKIIKEERL